jgi:hypothetical protein
MRLPSVSSQTRRTRARRRTIWCDLDDARADYDSVYRRSRPAANERRLMLAVLRGSIRTLVCSARSQRPRAARQRREEIAWLTNGDRSDVFAFENICDALEINAACLRRQIFQQFGLDVSTSRGA